ncbi:hypothetical protein VN97_g199 [Penicillium thymicola]|uniref:Uncharacterized protein n=1 Tax=Penicillium thymicola TaxID=293382 RepID=A0AAI9XD85_PENTH|nr:hypothetical protein VN97_g199 [Penicillium thymicola]
MLPGSRGPGGAEGRAQIYSVSKKRQGVSPNTEREQQEVAEEIKYISTYSRLQTSSFCLSNLQNNYHVYHPVGNKSDPVHCILYLRTCSGVNRLECDQPTCLLQQKRAPCCISLGSFYWKHSCLWHGSVPVLLRFSCQSVYIITATSSPSFC